MNGIRLIEFVLLFLITIEASGALFDEPRNVIPVIWVFIYAGLLFLCHRRAEWGYIGAMVVGLFAIMYYVVGVSSGLARSGSDVYILTRPSENIVVFIQAALFLLLQPLLILSAYKSQRELASS